MADAWFGAGERAIGEHGAIGSGSDSELSSVGGEEGATSDSKTDSDVSGYEGRETRGDL